MILILVRIQNNLLKKDIQDYDYKHLVNNV